MVILVLIMTYFHDISAPEVVLSRTVPVKYNIGRIRSSLIVRANTIPVLHFIDTEVLVTSSKVP